MKRKLSFSYLKTSRKHPIGSSKGERSLKRIHRGIVCESWKTNRIKTWGRRWSRFQQYRPRYYQKWDRKGFTRYENRNDQFGYDQFGFRKGCGTREAIGIMRTIGERYLQLGNGVYVWFIDYEKAFHRVMDLPPWRSWKNRCRLERPKDDHSFK